MNSLVENKPALFSAGSLIEIELKNISKKFPGVQALDNVDFFLKSNEVHAVVGENGVVKIVVRDKKNDTSNDFSIIVGDTSDVFSFNFKVENIKILPGTYEIVVSQKLISRFSSKNHDLTYFIALEPDSTFG